MTKALPAHGPRTSISVPAPAENTPLAGVLFSTYKSGRAGKHEVSVGEPYSSAHAWRVIEASMADYRDRFGALER